MAESDYFWTTARISRSYENWYTNFSVNISNAPYGFAGFYTGLAQDVIDIPQFSNPSRRWSSATVNEAYTLFQEHAELMVADAGGVTETSFTPPMYWQSVTFTDGSEIFGGYTGIDITVELYIFTYLASSSTFTNQQRYGIVIGIPKTYDPESVLTPAADYTPWIIHASNYPPFDPTTVALNEIFILNIDGPVLKPSIGEQTIEIARKGDITGTYYVEPGYESTLAKYSNPVTVIRAKFDTTRTAVIEDTVDGGFMIYEEVANAPVSPVYIYNGQRRLVQIIDAAYITQYRAS